MKLKTYYECTECGYRAPKYLGKCPSCGSWNTLLEQTAEAPAPAQSPKQEILMYGSSDGKPERIDSLTAENYARCRTGIGEFDRVLGGGIVSGSVVLLCGEPGIGKSTLLLQMCASLSKDKTVLYVTGEESGGQIGMRAKRLSVSGGNLYVLAETNVEKILSHCDGLKPDIIIIDSIQTTYHSASASIAGSVSQVRECALAFINRAKSDGISVLLVGHVNKEGTVAGPKVLEHMVDAVLYFEGERRQSFRVIRAIKNRYGSTDEIGVFEMTERGLREIPNPSEALLSDRPKNIPGSCGVCVIEGTRPIISEIQALVASTVFPSPRRMSTGIDYNRMAMILAVLEKRGGVRTFDLDVYLNVIGGIRIDETASDLGVAIAMWSAVRDRAIPDDTLFIGELGLSGELRAVSRAESRVAEASRLGFKRIFLPQRNVRDIQSGGNRFDAELIPVRSLMETIVKIDG